MPEAEANEFPSDHPNHPHHARPSSALFRSSLSEIPGPKRMARLKLVKTRRWHGRTG